MDDKEKYQKASEGDLQLAAEWASCSENDEGRAALESSALAEK